jgi:hypothetical protein
VPVPEAGVHGSFSRPVLRAEAALPNFEGHRLTLLNVHLKSRRPDVIDGEDRDDPVVEARAQLRSLIRRGAEAAALRRIVVETMRDSPAPLVVGGDFNDDARAVTTRIVADTSWQRDDRPQRDFMLFDALDVERREPPGRGRDVAFTILQGGEPERIDHLLVSEAFVRQSRHALGQVTAVQIFNDHLHERRRTDGVRLDRIYSDHAAVCVTIEPLR